MQLYPYTHHRSKHLPFWCAMYNNVDVQIILIYPMYIRTCTMYIYLEGYKYMYIFKRNF